MGDTNRRHPGIYESQHKGQRKQSSVQEQNSSFFHHIYMNTHTKRFWEELLFNTVLLFHLLLKKWLPFGHHSDGCLLEAVNVWELMKWSSSGACCVIGSPIVGCNHLYVSPIWHMKQLIIIIAVNFNSLCECWLLTTAEWNRATFTRKISFCVNTWRK